MSQNPHVLVVVANSEYTEQAKQVFGSAHENGKWNGDYVLLASGMTFPQIRWFTDRGISVIACENLYGKQRLGHYPATPANKLYIFSPYFRKWRKLLFLDADIIIRAPLYPLLRVRGFGAAPDFGDTTIADQFLAEHRKNPIVRALARSIDFDRPAFNTGVLMFEPSSLKRDILSRGALLMQKYGRVSTYAEQASLNILFYRTWVPLSRAYNAFPTGDVKADAEATILHFAGLKESMKPWSIRNQYHSEWVESRCRAETLRFGLGRGALVRGFRYNEEVKNGV